MKIDILVFGAHPDDVELGCGGTVIKLISQGKKIAIIDLTKGELGTRGTPQTRKEECKNATKILGVEIRENMDFKDGFFENDEKHKLALIKKIREYCPEIVIANAPSDRHPDHGRASQIVLDACFLSGLEKVETKQKIWRPKAIYHYIQFNNSKPDLVVDISSQMDKKLEAVTAYKTQFYDAESKEKETIISKKGFLKSVKYRAQDLGRLSHCKYAEGFIAHQMLKVDSFFDVK
jgi:bacillithiol biosynthesis deacetylase BshB1|tara:strand:+ start:1357 stop:2058 length:702 start_codon:yes stop_codon:yes gene_type:complete